MVHTMILQPCTCFDTAKGAAISDPSMTTIQNPCACCFGIHRAADKREDNDLSHFATSISQFPRKSAMTGSNQTILRPRRGISSRSQVSFGKTYQQLALVLKYFGGIGSSHHQH